MWRILPTCSGPTAFYLTISSMGILMFKWWEIKILFKYLKVRILIRFPKGTINNLVRSQVIFHCHRERHHACIFFYGQFGPRKQFWAGFSRFCRKTPWLSSPAITVAVKPVCLKVGCDTCTSALLVKWLFCKKPFLDRTCLSVSGFALYCRYSEFGYPSTGYRLQVTRNWHLFISRP